MMTRKVPLFIAMAIGVTSAIGLPAIPAGAATSPPGGKGDPTSVLEEGVDAPSSDFIASQERLLPAARALQAAIDPLESGKPTDPSGKASNFAEVSINPTAGVVDVWWKGAIPADIQAILDKYPDVPVNIHGATYSLNDFAAAEDALDLALHAKKVLGLGAVLQSVRIDPAAKSMSIDVYGDGSATQAAVEGLIKTLTSIPFTLHLSSERSATGGHPLGSRQDDSQPYYGGDGIFLNGDAAYCTTGFNIVVASGNNYGTTAFHCPYGMGSSGSINNPTTGGSYGTFKNQSSWLRPAYDTALVDWNSNDFGNVWVGGINSTSYATITGSDTSVIGQSVCVDGARTGDHCSPIVTAKNGVYYEEDGTRIAGNVEATSQVTAGMNGDSGGPVIEGSTSSRLGLGMLFQGIGGYETTCPSSVYRPSLGGTCYRRIIYTSLSGMLSSFGGSLK